MSDEVLRVDDDCSGGVKLPDDELGTFFLSLLTTWIGIFGKICLVKSSSALL